MEGYGILRNPKTGRTDPIGRYPTLANGIAANIAHLKSMPIVGKTVGQARHYWVYGNFNGTKPLIGMNNNQVITQELLNDPNWLAQWMRATASDEGFGNMGRKLDDASFNQAFAILKNNSNLDSSKAYASNNLPPDSNSKTIKPLVANAAAKVDSSNQQPPSTQESDKDAEIAQIQNNKYLTDEQKQSAIDKIKQVIDHPMIADLKSNIKNIYDKGMNKANAMQAVKLATSKGLDILNQFS